MLMIYLRRYRKRINILRLLILICLLIGIICWIFRFTSNRSITVNPPANTIHVSSLRRESCRTDNLRYIF